MGIGLRLIFWGIKMDLEYLTRKDWEEFKRQYPGALTFLIRQNEIKEWLYLNDKKQRLLPLHDFEIERFEYLDNKRK